MSRLVVIAAGGTGGHMFPAQALAEAMLARGWRVALSTDARGARYAKGFPAAVTRREVSAATTARGGALARLAAPLRLLGGALEAWRWFRRDRPACVVGFGGYPAFPALAAAWTLGLPRMIHEQNGVLGRVNRLFAARVGAVACGTWPLRNPPAGARLARIGNPVRPAVLAARSPYAPPGDGPARLLAFGGSQGASAVATALAQAARLLPADLRARLEITLQARVEDAEAVRAALADARPATLTIAAFFDDLPDRMAAAHLVVARAGASTVAELAALGRPSILIPYAAAMDDHQSANAAGLAEAGGAAVIAEGALTPAALAGHLSRLLTDDARLTAMAQAAAARGRPDAAERLADLVERLAAGDPVEETAP